MLGQLDALSIRSAAARKAYGFQSEAVNYENQSALDKHQAKSDKTAGYINAVTGLLKSGAEAGSAGTFDSWGQATNASALNSDSLGQVGPYDNSLPWHNTPTAA